ncbi:hypothetical protein ABT299_38745 [Spirillospora sp. NPDC000708]|jgi:Asp-tRNA(Asn)/Glu-tRNA(Gln) amidotransferase A subunit family amidase
MARTVADARLALHAMAGADLRDPFRGPRAPHRPARLLLIRPAPAGGVP